MSQHLNEDELAALLPEKTSTALQYTISFDESDKNLSDDQNLSDDHSKKHVSFHAISYEVTQRKCLKKLAPKVILNNVSGIMKTGLNAIMGPTGSGKTTLLDILSGHKSRKGLTGQVLINGRPQPVNFKCKSAYVVQDDFLMGTLTVRENIAFSAALRLSSEYNWNDRKDKVNQILEELALTEVADSKIGTEFVRGISGGEKKRTSIGMELIIAPGILFLDEPTTGLDASTATSVIRLLKDLSRQDRIIILSVHQPRYSIYKLFDTLTLLSKGYTVYHGPAGDRALQYFSNHGYDCEQHDNPADFFLDIVLLNEARESKHSITSSESPVDSVVQNKLAVAYAESSQFHDINKELMNIREHAIMKSETISQFSTNFLWQFGVLAVRAIRNLMRNPMASVVQLLVMAILAIVIGVIYFQLEDNYAGFQNRVGAFFFLTTNIVFGSLSALELFIKERSLFIYQNARGYFRVSSYFFAKVFCDLLPMRILPALLYSTISYWMLGLTKDILKFAIYTLTLLLTSCAATAIAFSTSAGISIFALANIFCVLSFIFQMIFGGFLVNLKSIAGWLSWMQYLSIFRFSLNALFENELKGNEYCDKYLNGTCIDNRKVVGDVYLDSLDFSKYSIWFNEMAIFIAIVINLLFAYIQLRLIKKER